MEMELTNRMLREKVKHETESTCRTYFTDLKILFKDMGKIFKSNSELEIIKKMDEDFLEDYFISMDKNNNETLIDTKLCYAQTSLNKKRIALNQLLDYAVKRHIISYNKLATVQPYKIREEDKKKKDLLDVEEMYKVIEQTYVRQKGDRNFEFNSARDRFILSLMFTTGLRISEAQSIELTDIEKVNNYYMVNLDKKKVKTGIDKRVPIANTTLLYYNEYIQERNNLKDTKDLNFLILSTNGKKIKGSETITKRIEKYISLVGIKKHITPHSQRYSFMTVASEQGKPLSIIYAVGGWKFKTMADTYLKTTDSMLDESKVSCCNIL